MRHSYIKLGDFLRETLWKHRVRNRLYLAWWAFCNPDNLTMLAHEIRTDCSETVQVRRQGSNEWQHHSSAHAAKCQWWARRYLNLPVR